MPVNSPRDEYSLLRRIAELERRVRELETSGRAGNTAITSGKMTIGDPEAAARIELDGATPAIRLHSASGGEAVIQGRDNGAELKAESDTVLSYPCEASFDNFSYQARMTAEAMDLVDTQASVTAQVQEGVRRAEVILIAQSATNKDDCIIHMLADGGVAPPVLPGNPSGTGIGVLYIVGNALRYKDAGGTVHAIA